MQQIASQVRNDGGAYRHGEGSTKQSNKPVINHFNFNVIIL